MEISNGTHDFPEEGGACGQVKIDSSTPSINVIDGAGNTGTYANGAGGVSLGSS